MSAYQLLSETIPEVNIIGFDNLIEDNLDDLNEKMNYLTHTIGHDLIKLKKNINKVAILFDNINKMQINDFDNQEYIEEQLDSMIYEYAKIKQYLKKGRTIRYYKVKKEKLLIVNNTESNNNLNLITE